MKIAFLLNHYDVHQVPHVVPYAFQLSLRHPNFQVLILSPGEDQLSFAEQIGRSYLGHKVDFVKLQLSALSKLTDPLASRFLFSRKFMTLFENTALWSAFNALVVPETNTTQLRRIPQLQDLKLIRVSHGAGDQRGLGSFDDRMRDFDMVLAPGEKYATELVQDGHVEAEKLAVSGYTKFEVTNNAAPAQPERYFQNNRPTVLYNPHHRRDLSSWWKMGRKVLDFFYNSPDYNLIFAPHVLLFKRPWGKGAHLPRKYRNTPNVLIDRGSRRSCDMSYLNAADIYLGDASSQIYEFIRRPRPFAFLNAHDVDYFNDPSYASWHFGPVVRNLDDLAGALRLAQSHGEHYLPIQQERFAYTFADFGARKPSECGADIIAQYLATGNVSSRPLPWPANFNCPSAKLVKDVA
ncbi:MAG: hypothetical protein GY948_21940 [Alphaproteobacteria bacterium]|nr:hypothetical protein [Alphaproteobacteria bacterium]